MDTVSQCNRRCFDKTDLTPSKEPAKRCFEDGSEEWIQGYLDKFRN